MDCIVHVVGRGALMQDSSAFLPFLSFYIYLNIFTLTNNNIYCICSFMLFGFKAMKINHIFLNPLFAKKLSSPFIFQLPLHENKHNQHTHHYHFFFQKEPNQSIKISSTVWEDKGSTFNIYSVFFLVEQQLVQWRAVMKVTNS